MNVSIVVVVACCCFVLLPLLFSYKFIRCLIKNLKSPDTVRLRPPLSESVFVARQEQLQRLCLQFSQCKIARQLARTFKVEQAQGQSPKNDPNTAAQRKACLGSCCFLFRLFVVSPMAS